MNKHSRGFSVLSYFTWIGWLVSYFMRDKNDSLVKVHLNQALVLNLCSMIIGFMASRFDLNDGLMGLLVSAISLGVTILNIMGIVRALQMSEEPLPIVGDIKILN